MGNCKDCRHWGKLNRINTQEMRQCAAIPDINVADSDVAFTIGDYGEASSLETGPTFGCVLFEAQETT